MLLLAIECSSETRSVALAESGRVLSVRSLPSGRSTPILGWVDELLTVTGHPRETVATLLVGLGPGSYTGIRTALAAAAGWAAAREIQVHGLDSVAACAMRAWDEGHRGRVGCVIDAQRDEFYLEQLDLTPEGPRRPGSLNLVSRREVEALAASGTPLLGPSAGPGGGMGLPGVCCSPDAASLVRAAALMPSLVRTPPLEPVYLRPTTFVKAPAARTVT